MRLEVSWHVKQSGHPGSQKPSVKVLPYFDPRKFIYHPPLKRPSLSHPHYCFAFFAPFAPSREISVPVRQKPRFLRCRRETSAFIRGNSRHPFARAESLQCSASLQCPI